jgi:DNA-binding transcriptional ArsR family regulator
MQTHGELCVCEVERFLDVSQSTASRHLRTLARAGWVEARREEQWVYYRIAEPRDEQHRVLLETLRTLLEGVETPPIGDALTAKRDARCRESAGCVSAPSAVPAG